ncbi:MAG: hypothetical protein WA609_11990 [Terriglobales bacterium]
MNLVGLISTAVLSLALVAAVPVYAQDQHEKQDEKAKPTQEEKKAEPEQKKAEQKKPAKQQAKGAQRQEKNNKQGEKSAQQAKSEQHQAKPEGHVEHAAAGRIPAERYKANFGREHTFHVSQAEYSGGRRFQYGGYWFGFVDPWPSNWLYSQDVFVVEINGMYYLCNPAYPGVNIALNVTM